MNPSLVTRVVMTSLALNWGIHECLAQVEAEAKTAGFPLEQVADRLNKMDATWTEQVKAAEKLVSDERVAKRLSESAAQSLTWTVRNASSLMFESRALANARIPAENKALNEAFLKLTALQDSLQSERATLLENTLKEVRARTAKVMQGPATVEDVDALTKLFESIQTTLQSRGGSATNNAANKVSGSVYFLGQLRRLIDAESSGDIPALTSALADFRMNYGGQDVVSDVERRKRLEAAIKPYQKAEEDKQKALDSALESRKPVEEISKAFAEYAAASGKLRSVRANDLRGTKDSTSAYRRIIDFLKAAESGDSSQIKYRAEQAHNAATELGGEGRERLEQLITKTERDLGEQEEKRAAAYIENLRKKIAEAKEAGDVDAILRDLRDPSKEPRGTVEVNVVNSLVQPLSTIATAWRSNSPQLLQSIDGSSSGSRNPADPEIASLRGRAVRDVTVRVLRAPELNQAPLAEMPLNEAIETLCDQLVEKREWRRLLQVLESRSGAASEGRYYSGGNVIPTDAISALRAYFVAQNFELAEMWLDAADSYRTVLRSTSPRAPITDAAQRLKKLVKEHPEAERKAESAPVLRGQ